MAKASKKIKPEIPKGPVCPICGSSGLVHRAYVEPEVGMPRAKDMVACPKCRKNS